jgi:alkanesulfonate monooxygenase SsuD/methylene tetrahydromethanopterin reductase-like flavin-dependent oxidoreductase (luciferase family)
MATKLPLVLGADGLPQQLQSTDTINAPTSTLSTRAVTNGESSASITIGMPVYASAADTVKRAQANAKSTSKLAGLVYDTTISAAAIGNIATTGTLVATTAQWDAVAGTTGGLAFGTLYFVDPATVGKITSTAPTTVGQCVTLVGTALSTIELELQIAQPILL